jgi:hypothetical protein
LFGDRQIQRTAKAQGAVEQRRTFISGEEQVETAEDQSREGVLEEEEGINTLRLRAGLGACSSQ